MTTENTAPPFAMPTMCKALFGQSARSGQFTKSGQSGFTMVALIPSLVLIGIGVLVLIYPQILAWIIAAVMIMMGLGFLFMVGAMRKLGARLHDRTV